MALIDPAIARTVLEQLQSRAGLDPVKLWNTREPWITAWALVELDKTETLVTSALDQLAQQKQPAVYNCGVFPMIELLLTPPAHRPSSLGTRSHSGFWWPTNLP